MRDRQGFTLIEVLVVMAIITILAAIIFPTFATAKESARRTKCISDLRQIGMAVEMYCQDYDDDYAVPPFLGTLYPSYIESASMFICPSDRGIYNGRITPPSNAVVWEQTRGIPSGTSYCYYPLVYWLWSSWPSQYGYDFMDAPLAACHIHHLNANLRDIPILVLTRSASVRRTDTWEQVRMGPSQWR